jgi:ribosomal-protein-alanine N-acetyltransferase
MELANVSEINPPRAMVRMALKSDAPAITKLLQTSQYGHVHLDWRTPVEWLGSTGFVVHVRLPRQSLLTQHTSARAVGREHGISGCLAVAADPPPAAWVRVAAVGSSGRPFLILGAMLARALETLRLASVDQLGWLAGEAWPTAWLYGLGFEPVNKIETYWKDDLDLPPTATVPDLSIRPVEGDDMEGLAKLEKAAFDPLWRHSAEGLALARREASGFDVAVLQGRIVGFLLSVRSHSVAHLVRLTVDPELHGIGIGSTLLAHAILGYRAQGVRQVSLNTQVDNLASQYLYRKFGFYSRGERLPVWAMVP